MKALDFVCNIVAGLVVVCIICTMGLMFVNTVAPMSKQEQAQKLEPTLEMYRAFDLTPAALKSLRENPEYETVARGRQ